METHAKEAHKAVDYLIPAPTPEKETTTGLWPLVGMLFHWRKFIAGVTFLGAVGAVVVSLLIPKQFTAEARVLPPENSPMSPLTSILSRSMPSAASTLLKGSRGEYMRYLSILTSRRMYASVVDSFDLVEVYEKQDEDAPVQAAIDQLKRNTSFPVNEEYEYLAISVTDRDPERAARMANFFVDELNRVNGELSAQTASGYRRFVERRYNRVQSSVDSLLDAVQSFQRRHGLYNIPAQTESYFEQVGRMRAELGQAEIQYEAMREQLGSSNAQVQSLAGVVKAARDQYNRALAGQEQVLPVPRSQISSVMREYADLERERITQTALLEMVGPLLEQARFEEERKIEALQVIDRAVPPVKKSAPRRSLIVINITLSVFILSVLYALFIHRLRRDRHRYARLLANSIEQAAR